MAFVPLFTIGMDVPRARAVVGNLFEPNTMIACLQTARTTGRQKRHRDAQSGARTIRSRSVG